MIKLSKNAKLIRYDEVHDWWDHYMQLASYDGFNLGYATAKQEMEDNMAAKKKASKKTTAKKATPKKK